MRLFVAVDLDEHLRRAAARVARSLRDNFEKSETYGVSWVGTDNLHLTLRFLGELGDEQAKKVHEQFAVPFSLPRFNLQVSGVGMFPPHGSARVIWLGIVEGQEQLRQLHEQVEQRLASLEIEPESKPYRAHLTIGRFRVPAPARVRELALVPDVDAIGRCVIDHVTLYKSQLSPKGAIYTPLVRAPLA